MIKITKIFQNRLDFKQTISKGLSHRPNSLNLFTDLCREQRFFCTENKFSRASKEQHLTGIVFAVFFLLRNFADTKEKTIPIWYSVAWKRIPYSIWQRFRWTRKWWFLLYLWLQQTRWHTYGGWRTASQLAILWHKRYSSIIDRQCTAGHQRLFFKHQRRSVWNIWRALETVQSGKQLILKVNLVFSVLLLLKSGNRVGNIAVYELSEGVLDDKIIKKGYKNLRIDLSLWFYRM